MEFKSTVSILCIRGSKARHKAFCALPQGKLFIFCFETKDLELNWKWLLAFLKEKLVTRVDCQCFDFLYYVLAKCPSNMHLIVFYSIINK